MQASCHPTPTFYSPSLASPGPAYSVRKRHQNSYSPVVQGYYGPRPQSTGYSTGYSSPADRRQAQPYAENTLQNATSIALCAPLSCLSPLLSPSLSHTTISPPTEPFGACLKIPSPDLLPSETNSQTISGSTPPFLLPSLVHLSFGFRYPCRFVSHVGAHYFCFSDPSLLMVLVHLS